MAEPRDEEFVRQQLDLFKRVYAAVRKGIPTENLSPADVLEVARAVYGEVNDWVLSEMIHAHRLEERGVKAKREEEEPASEKQLGYLRSLDRDRTFNIPDPSTPPGELLKFGWSRKKASEIIDYLQAKEKQ